MAKCKAILVGKKSEKYHKSRLYVDSWKVSHKSVNIRGGQEKSGNILVEDFQGKVSMEFVNSYKYLGHWISNCNNDMVNIDKMKSKSIGIKRKIFNYLDSLSLGQYYFECSIILMNSLLRRSI